MSDLLERLTAANPVPDAEPPPIADVWRKVVVLDAQPQPGRYPRLRAAPKATGRVLLALAAVLIPIVVVLTVAIPLHVAHDSPKPGSPNLRAGESALDQTAQRVAALALAGRPGSVVALDPRTGAIRAMIANVTRGGTPLTGAAAGRVLYPPEATFDIVTAAAALDSALYAPHSRVAGSVTLTEALSLSRNAAFARIGERVGRETLSTYMRRFGFYSAQRLTATSDPLPISGVRLSDRVLSPTDPRVNLGRLAAGQGGLSTTPLQMAMVAAAVADGGKLMSPHLGNSSPRLVTQVMSSASARSLTEMMREVVTHGTATAAGARGLRVAAKTGTAHPDSAHPHATIGWLIGFAPVKDPKIAIAVALADARGGYGGTEAAPIAIKVIRALLAGR